MFEEWTICLADCGVDTTWSGSSGSDDMYLFFNLVLLLRKIKEKKKSPLLEEASGQ